MCHNDTNCTGGYFPHELDGAAHTGRYYVKLDFNTLAPLSVREFIYCPNLTAEELKEVLSYKVPLFAGYNSKNYEVLNIYAKDKNEAIKIAQKDGVRFCETVMNPDYNND